MNKNLFVPVGSNAEPKILKHDIESGKQIKSMDVELSLESGEYSEGTLFGYASQETPSLIGKKPVMCETETGYIISNFLVADASQKKYVATLVTMMSTESVGIKIVKLYYIDEE